MNNSFKYFWYCGWYTQRTNFLSRFGSSFWWNGVKSASLRFSGKSFEVILSYSTFVKGLGNRLLQTSFKSLGIMILKVSMLLLFKLLISFLMTLVSVCWKSKIAKITFFYEPDARINSKCFDDSINRIVCTWYRCIVLSDIKIFNSVLKGLAKINW